MSREFLPGQVMVYPYLWSWQDEGGETERAEKPADLCRRRCSWGE